MVTAGQDWVVVSGGAGAIGSAVAQHFSGLGRQVLSLDRDMGNAAAGVTGISCDLLSRAEIKQALAAIPRPDRIALLVNTVGLIHNEPVLSFRGARLSPHDEASFRAVVDANLVAPFLVASEAAALMARSGGGAIVNFSSIAADGNAGQVAYSAAKAGIEGMTKTMAIELGALGIRTNALALGFIGVATTRDAVDGERLAEYERRTPVGRLGELADVLAAIEFSAESPFLNGAVIKLDGGLRL